MSPYREVLGGTQAAAIPLTVPTSSCTAPTPPGGTCTPETYLETGRPSVLSIFPAHLELMVLVPEQTSVSLLKGVMMESDKSEQGVISLGANILGLSCKIALFFNCQLQVKKLPTTDLLNVVDLDKMI